MKKVTVFIALISILLLTGCTNSNSTYVANLENYRLVTNYVSENTWDYSVIGQMPTPCHDFGVEAIVSASIPEQVTIKITEIRPNSEQFCIQVIAEKTHGGSFSASEQASIKLSK